MCTMKILLILLLILTIISCENRSQDSSSMTSKSKDKLKVENMDNSRLSSSKNKIEIEFDKNKDLLDIILLLPDSAFSSWEWTLEDRISWYNEIKAHNYYIDDNPDFFNQKYFYPNQAGYTIVDGFWSINIYKTADNSFIVITNDIVGDGNLLNFYEVKSGSLKKYLDEKIIFSNFKEQLKKKENMEYCEEKYEEMNDPIFVYDFTCSNKVQIESSLYLNKENYETCLNGNAIIYTFNPKTKKFEIEEIYWKPRNK